MHTRGHALQFFCVRSQMLQRSVNGTLQREIQREEQPKIDAGIASPAASAFESDDDERLEILRVAKASVEQLCGHSEFRQGELADILAGRSHAIQVRSRPSHSNRVKTWRPH